MKIKRETGLTVVSHLTCVGSSRDEIYGILEKYHESGIENIMALRGDPPQGSKNYEPEVDGFYYATDLVAFIKKHFPSMGIGVAGYPEGHADAPNRLKEIDFLKEKVDAGADFITTQLYFDNRDFYDFCERCEIAGMNVPIIAGIMPITSMKTMGKMAELSRGTRFPAPLLKALSRAEGDDYIEKVGVHWATQQVMDLLDKGVSGIHFYTLNQSRATRMVYDSLGVTSSRQLQ
jgi:methylenetetrahydrofolate reductase (NADPH)